MAVVVVVVVIAVVVAAATTLAAAEAVVVVVAPGSASGPTIGNALAVNFSCGCYWPAVLDECCESSVSVDLSVWSGFVQQSHQHGPQEQISLDLQSSQSVSTTPTLLSSNRHIDIVPQY